MVNPLIPIREKKERMKKCEKIQREIDGNDDGRIGVFLVSLGRFKWLKNWGNDEKG